MYTSHTYLCLEMRVLPEVGHLTYFHLLFTSIKKKTFILVIKSSFQVSSGYVEICV